MQNGERPGWRSRPKPIAPSRGVSGGRSTSDRPSGVSLQLDPFTSPVVLSHGGRCRVVGPVGGCPPPVPALVHADPVARANGLVPVGTALTGASWGDPRSVGSVPRPVSATVTRAGSVPRPSPGYPDHGADLRLRRSLDGSVDPTPIGTPVPRCSTRRRLLVSLVARRRRGLGRRWAVDLVLIPSPLGIR